MLNDALIARRLFILKSNTINLKISLLKATMITIAISTLITIIIIGLKIKITAIRALRSVIEMITIMLIAKYMSFILLRSIFRKRNNKLWIASFFNISLRTKTRLSNIAFWIFQLITFARSKTLINRRFLSTLKKYVLLST